MPEITAEMMAGWTTDDTYKVNIAEEAEPAKGALKNPNFPDKVKPDESWTGTIDGVNVGGGSGTFRFAVDGKTTDSFTLDPGQAATLKLRGTGGASFTIKIQRST